MNPPSERRFPHLPLAKAEAGASSGAASFLEDLTHIHQTLNASSHPIRSRLLRLTSDSSDLLAVIKQEGKI